MNDIQKLMQADETQELLQKVYEIEKNSNEKTVTYIDLLGVYTFVDTNIDSIDKFNSAMEQSQKIVARNQEKELASEQKENLNTEPQQTESVHSAKSAKSAKETVEILGNTAYRTIKEKSYINTTSTSAKALAQRLDESKIKYSGRIVGEKGVLTVNKNDYAKVINLAEINNISLAKPKSVTRLEVEDSSGNKTSIVRLPSDMETLNEEIKNKLTNVLDGENFKKFCKSSSLYFLRNYSFRNALLIYAQHPNPTFVCSANSWKQYGRMVNAGEKGLKIRVPTFYNFNNATNATLHWRNLKAEMKANFNSQKGYGEARIGETNITIAMHNDLYDIKIGNKQLQGNLPEETVKKFINDKILGKTPISYTVKSVFDISQTNTNAEFIWLKSGFKKSDLVIGNNGKPITNSKGEYKVKNTDERKNNFAPYLDMRIPPQDTAKMTMLLEVLKSVSEKRGFPIEERSKADDEVMSSGAEGYFSRTDRKIVLDESLEITKKCSVALHEMGHSEMHSELSNDVDRKEREVQAETAAYITAQRFGIDTEISSFDYIATYTKGRDIEEVEKLLDTVWTATRKLSNQIDNELRERGLTKDLQPNYQARNEAEVKAIISERKELVFSFAQRNADKKEEILTAYKQAKGEEEKNVIKTELKVCERIEQHLNNINDKLVKLESTKDKLSQDNLILEVRKGFDKIGIAQTEQIKLLEERKVFDKDTLQKEFLSNPYKFVQERNEFADLSERQKKIIALSKFISNEYSPILNENISQFASLAKKQAENVENVMSKNGTAVEVVSAEKWGTKTRLNEGMALTPHQANAAIARMELENQIAQQQGYKRDEYFPTAKTKLTIYTPLSDNRLFALTTNLNIGNKKQVDLINHLENTCKRGEDRLAVVENFKTAVAEKDKRADLVLSAEKTEEIAKSDETRISVDEAELKIAERRDMISEENEQNEREQEQDHEYTLDELNLLNEEKAPV